MPCYDFTLIIDPTVVPVLRQGLRVLPTLLVWRAVSTRSENVFTGAFWSPITSKSGFKESSCRLLSELGPVFWDWLRLATWQPSVPAIVPRVLPKVSKGHADLTSSPPSSQTFVCEQTKEIPRNNNQDTNKSQETIIKNQTFWNFENWSLEIIWKLEFGYWWLLLRSHAKVWAVSCDI